MRKYRRSETFNLAFLDIMSCGLGAVVLVFMLVKHHVSDPTHEADLLTQEVQKLETQQASLQYMLEQLKNISQSEAEKIAQLRARLAQIKQSLTQKELSLAQKKNQLAALKSDISSRPVAQKEDLIQDDRGGEENYLMGLRVEGKRIVVLIDSSASMTDESLLNIIKRKNGSAQAKKKGPKWQRTKRIARWVMARIPKGSQVSVIMFNHTAKPLGKSGWAPNNTATLQSLYQGLDAIIPTGATNLQKGLQAASRLKATNLYLITDGLPTKGESRYASLNPFSGCSSLLGRSNTISGECRVKLFRQTVRDVNLRGVTANVILLPIEGDPDAANEYWSWTASTGGLIISPAANWP